MGRQPNPSRTRWKLTCVPSIVCGFKDYFFVHCWHIRRRQNIFFWAMIKQKMVVTPLKKSLESFVFEIHSIFLKDNFQKIELHNRKICPRIWVIFTFHNILFHYDRCVGCVGHTLLLLFSTSCLCCKLNQNRNCYRNSISSPTQEVLLGFGGGQSASSYQKARTYSLTPLEYLFRTQLRKNCAWRSKKEEIKWEKGESHELKIINCSKQKIIRFLNCGFKKILKFYHS